MPLFDSALDSCRNLPDNEYNICAEGIAVQLKRADLCMRIENTGFRALCVEKAATAACSEAQCEVLTEYWKHAHCKQAVQEACPKP